MQHHDVDGLDFAFPDDWAVGKYDEWSFYRNRFAGMWPGIKSIDLLAVAPDKTAWLIEAKDYRVHPRTKPSELPDEVARKVFDTLAAMIPAKVHANDHAERNQARAICGARALRVVLHLEQPAKHSRLRPRAIDPANLTQKMRKLLKPVDAHPIVVDMTTATRLAWRVS